MSSNPNALHSTTGAAIGLGNQQASAAIAEAGSAGPKPTPGAATPPKKGVNKFEKGLADLQKGAALGVNAQEAIRLKSKGQEDWTHKILLSIKKQYFTIGQVMQTFTWGLIMGAFVGAVIVASTAPDAMLLIDSKTSPQIWGIVVMSAGVSAFFLKRFTRPTIKKCSSDKKYNVEPEFHNRECLGDEDCTNMEEPAWQSCRIPKFGKTSRFIQGFFPWLALFFGVVLFVFAKAGTDLRPHQTDVAQAIIYGIFGGSMLMFVFSF